MGTPYTSIVEKTELWLSWNSNWVFLLPGPCPPAVRAPPSSGTRSGKGQGLLAEETQEVSRAEVFGVGFRMDPKSLQGPLWLSRGDVEFDGNILPLMTVFLTHRAPGSCYERPERPSTITYDYSEEELMASIEQEYCC